MGWLSLSLKSVPSASTRTNETCLERTGGICPFFRAKQASVNAHLLIVNHALLLTDVAAGNRILPEYEYLIVDEGHHLEAATTDALSFRTTQGDVFRLLRGLGGPTSGILGYLLSLMEEGDKLPVAGKVVWITPRGAGGSRAAGIGIQFNDQDDTARKKIETYLAGSEKSDRPTHTM